MSTQGPPSVLDRELTRMQETGQVHMTATVADALLLCETLALDPTKVNLFGRLWVDDDE